jgi:hypothetical protein
VANQTKNIRQPVPYSQKKRKVLRSLWISTKHEPAHGPKTRQVLVEIGSEGGRRHNSPPENSTPLRRDTAEGPLGDGRNTQLLLLPLLSMFHYTTIKLLLPLLLRLPSNTMKENEALRERKPRIKLVPSELSSH